MADRDRKARKDEILASVEAEFAVEDEVDALEAEFRKAHRAFIKSRTDASRDAYKAAKTAFADRRNELRDMQVANQFHPRMKRNSVVGVSSGTVTYDDGTVEEH